MMQAVSNATTGVNLTPTLGTVSLIIVHSFSPSPTTLSTQQQQQQQQQQSQHPLVAEVKPTIAAQPKLILPAPNSSNSKITPGKSPLKPAKKFRSEDTEILRCKRRLDFARLGLPLHRANPASVARRNERERNRVRLINSSFARLKDTLPREFNWSCDTDGTDEENRDPKDMVPTQDNSKKGQSLARRRQANKKLSKVNTLRGAIEYIRLLEDILSSDENSLPPTPSPSYVPPITTSSLYHSQQQQPLVQDTMKTADAFTFPQSLLAPGAAEMLLSSLSSFLPYSSSTSSSLSSSLSQQQQQPLAYTDATTSLLNYNTEITPLLLAQPSVPYSQQQQQHLQQQQVVASSVNYFQSLLPDYYQLQPLSSSSHQQLHQQSPENLSVLLNWLEQQASHKVVTSPVDVTVTSPGSTYSNGSISSIVTSSSDAESPILNTDDNSLADILNWLKRDSA